MRTRTFNRTFLIMACAVLCAPLFGQQTQKPLTNLDVIKMVKGGVPESVVISSIQSRKTKFDISPDGLIALHKAGVTPGEMDAIMGASGHAAGAPPSGPVTAGASPAAAAAGGTQPAAASAPPASKSKWHMPTVTVMQNGSSQELPLEKTQLATTKAKPSSMKSLAGDSALQSGISTATLGAETHMNSGMGAGSIQEAGSVFSGIMGHRKPAVTYLWGVPNPASTNVLQTTTPTFSVNFANAPGINPDDYEPAIVKLTPAQNTCRLVGATQAKEDAGSSPAADWEVYSHFLEERVAVNAKKLATGKYEMSSTSELLPGEYGVVLRPISKSKKFSGGDVARGQGDGLVFDAVWSFQVHLE
jgi:hypothetical protein